VAATYSFSLTPLTHSKFNRLNLHDLVIILVRSLSNLVKKSDFMVVQRYCFVLATIMIGASSFLRYSHIATALRKPVSLVRRSIGVGAMSTSPSQLKKHEVFAEVNAPLLAMELPSNDSSDLLLKIRHTSAHILAMAVQRTFPHVKVTIGPWIESG